MTGFGSASKTQDDLSVSVELKSVNYRFKEVNARLPRPLLYFEDKLSEHQCGKRDRLGIS